MSTEPQVVSLAPSPLRSVPRAVWVGGALLSLVTAGLAGALIMRSVDPAPASVASLPSTPAAASAPVGQPVPLVAPAATPSTTTVAGAKPVPSTKPAPGTGAATTSPGSAQAPLTGTTPAVVCASCGVVESVQSVQKKGQGTGLGAVAGGVLGGVVGHQVGGGNGKTAMTVLGAIGGGLAGNEVEKRARSETLFDIHVRMDDGSTRVFQRAQAMAVGAHVVVEGSTLRLARSGGTGPTAPRTQRTSTAAGAT